jgi:hypothetical protein
MLTGMLPPVEVLILIQLPDPCMNTRLTVSVRAIINAAVIVHICGYVTQMYVSGWHALRKLLP